MMLRDDRRAIRLRQRTVEPLQPRRAELAAGRPWNQRVQDDETYRKVVDRVLHEAILAGEVSELRKRRAQPVAIVVIADGEVDRHPGHQWRKHLAQHAVFLGCRVIGQISGGDDRVGQPWQRQHLGDAPLEKAGRVDASVRQSAVGHDVRITDLAQQHAALS